MDGKLNRPITLLLVLAPLPIASVPGCRPQPPPLTGISVNQHGLTARLTKAAETKAKSGAPGPTDGPSDIAPPDRPTPRTTRALGVGGAGNGEEAPTASGRGGAGGAPPSDR